MSNKQNKVIHDLMFSNEVSGDYVAGTVINKRVKEVFYACEECGQAITCDGDIISDLQMERINWVEDDNTRYVPGNCCKYN